MSILFILVFVNNSIISCFFSSIIDLYFLISATIAQSFNPNAELVIPIRIPSKEAKAKIEIYPATVEA